MRDIENRADIEKIMTAFYDKVFIDDFMNFYFTTITQVNLEKHLPRITDFWESTLFNTVNYTNNILTIHEHLNTLAPFKYEHFNRWVAIFCECIDEMYSGINAEKAKEKAASIGMAMKMILVKNF